MKSMGEIVAGILSPGANLLTRIYNFWGNEYQKRFQGNSKDVGRTEISTLTLSKLSGIPETSYIEDAVDSSGIANIAEFSNAVEQLGLRLEEKGDLNFNKVSENEFTSEPEPLSDEIQKLFDGLTDTIDGIILEP